MPTTNLLSFVRKTLRELDIKSYILNEPFPWNSGIDCGLRETILSDTSDLQNAWSKNLIYVCKESILATVSDAYRCEYICLRLPDNPGLSVLVIGPFTYEIMSADRVLDLCKHVNLPGNLTSFMMQYYQSLPFLSDARWIKGLCRNLAEVLWQNREIQVATYSDDHLIKPAYNTEHPVPTSDSLQQLETRYANEDVLMKAISTGDLATVEHMLQTETLPYMKHRFADHLRDKKNTLIILNTLCRKAGESGHVHPVYLDEISGKYAFEIERSTNIDQLNKMVRCLVREYCLLVQSHSLRGYSHPIRQAINHISFNLTEDLSLSAIASILMLNSSYLSTLFKKETGMTLTYYVNLKRIEHAIFLLNTTMLPIQEIAVLCGISDLNYFTKTFKKYQNMTPTEYREIIKGN